MFKFLQRTEEDFVMFGEMRVEIPKLTPKKWKALFAEIEILPQIVLDVMAARISDDFTATLIVALQMAIDEVVKLIAVLSGLEAAWIEENVGHNELIEFIARTVQKNNLSDAAKKYLSAFVKRGNQPANAAE